MNAQSMQCDLGLVAGETSSDLMASLVLQGIYQRHPNLHAAGIGGPYLQAQGFEAWWPSSKLAVHGYWDALLHYRELSGIRRELLKRWTQQAPQVFMGCDAPDFNLELEQQLRAKGIPTVHFISPSIWAWRAERMEKIRQAVDLMLCIFPFEVALYEKAGVAARYLGHPLASLIPPQPNAAAARVRLGFDHTTPLLALLPGSRRGEMKRLGPLFIQTAQQLAQAHARLEFVVPFSEPGLRAEFEKFLQHQQAQNLRWHLLDGQSHTAIEAADAVLVASGTATLECVLYQKPMVIAYRVAPLSYALMKRMAYLPWIGLPNILLRDFAVPEFIQHHATPAALAQACETALFDRSYQRALAARFAPLHAQLKRDTPGLAAQAVLELMRHES